MNCILPFVSLVKFIRGISFRFLLYIFCPNRSNNSLSDNLLTSLKYVLILVYTRFAQSLILLNTVLSTSLPETISPILVAVASSIALSLASPGFIPSLMYCLYHFLNSGVLVILASISRIRPAASLPNFLFLLVLAIALNVFIIG